MSSDNQTVAPILRRIARRLGVRLDPRNPSRKGHQWDGESIGIGGAEPSSILHELAHVAICRARAPERLRLPDFGLGQGPESRRFARCVVEDPDEEEALASALGISWERKLQALGLPFDWEDTAWLHNWDDGAGPRRWERLWTTAERARDLLRAGALRA